MWKIKNSICKIEKDRWKIQKNHVENLIFYVGN